MALAPCKFGNFFQMVVVAGSLVAYKVKPGLHWKCVLYHKDQFGFLDAIASLQFSMLVRWSVTSLDFDNLMSCHSHF